MLSAREADRVFDRLTDTRRYTGTCRPGARRAAEYEPPAAAFRAGLRDGDLAARPPQTSRARSSAGRAGARRATAASAAGDPAAVGGDGGRRVSPRRTYSSAAQVSRAYALEAERGYAAAAAAAAAARFSPDSPPGSAYAEIHGYSDPRAPPSPQQPTQEPSVFSRLTDANTFTGMHRATVGLGPVERRFASHVLPRRAGPKTRWREELRGSTETQFYSEAEQGWR